MQSQSNSSICYPDFDVRLFTDPLFCWFSDFFAITPFEAVCLVLDYSAHANTFFLCIFCIIRVFFSCVFYTSGVWLECLFKNNDQIDMMQLLLTF